MNDIVLDDGLLQEKEYFVSTRGIVIRLLLILPMIVSIAISMYLVIVGYNDHLRNATGILYALMLIFGCCTVYMQALNFNLLFSFWYHRKPVLTISKTSIKFKLGGRETYNFLEVENIEVDDKHILGTSIKMQLKKNVEYKLDKYFTWEHFYQSNKNGEIFLTIP